MSYLMVMVISCFSIVTARRDDDGEDSDSVYDEEDDDEDGTFPSRFVSMKGDLRESFAMMAAIDNQDMNMICSPLSALLPLGKLAIGAKDEASDELLQAVGVSRKRKLKSHFKQVIEDLKYLDGVELHMASRIYLSKDANLHRKFLDRAQSIFGSTAEKVDFNNANDAAYVINNWVSKKTNGIVHDLLSSSQINPSSSLILVNAIYFAGQWKETFDKVRPGKFYTPSGEKEVTMMEKKDYFNYHGSTVLGARLIELPYEGDGASFIMLLPIKRNGLPALLSQLRLAPELLNMELRKMTKTKVTLTMPRFTVESKLNLIHLYKKIGLRHIFDSHDSGLRKIVRHRTVFVSEAVQKAAIQVFELGTEAAAASAVSVVSLSLMPEREFTADHPFLYYVISRRQQLFVGTLVNPNDNFARGYIVTPNNNQSSYF